MFRDKKKIILGNYQEMVKERRETEELGEREGVEGNEGGKRRVMNRSKRLRMKR